MKNPFIANKLDYLLAKITPQLARFLLNQYYGNIRNESRGHISRLKNSMNKGHFYANNDCLAFEIRSGIILNGHHRLTAIAESGVTVEIGVCIGISRVALRSMDTGNIRDNGTCIASSLGEKDANVIWRKRASVANMCIRSENNFKLSDLPDNTDKLNYYHGHQCSMDSVLCAGVNRKTNGSGFRGAMVLYFQDSPRKAQEFYNLVTGNGDDLQPKTPACSLYMFFNRSERGNGGESNRMKKDFRATQRATQAHAKGETLLPSELEEYI